MFRRKLQITSLISTMSPVLKSGTGLSCSDASIALLFNIYEITYPIILIRSIAKASLNKKFFTEKLVLAIASLLHNRQNLH